MAGSSNLRSFSDAKWRPQHTGVEKIRIVTEVWPQCLFKDLLNLFKCLEICFSKDGELQNDVIMRAGKGMKTFSSMKVTFKVRNVSVCMKRELYEEIILTERTSRVRE